MSYRVGIDIGETFTDAFATRSGPRMGLIATKGHRNAIQLRRVRKDNVWDWRWPFPQPLVPLHLRVSVEERVDAYGSILKPLDEVSDIVGQTLIVDGGLT